MGRKYKSGLINNGIYPIMAKKMLEKNKPLDEIIYFTDLIKEEVQKLK